MNPEKMRARLEALGYVTQEQMAEALFGQRKKQNNVSRWLGGQRPVPSWTERTLQLLEQDPPVILSELMRRALDTATGPGEPVTPPNTDELPVRLADWDKLFDAMERLGVIDFRAGVDPEFPRRRVAVLTQLGAMQKGRNR